MFGKGEVVEGHRWYRSKERRWFPMLSIVTIALSLNIRPEFAIECLRRSNQQGHFGAKFGEEGAEVRFSIYMVCHAKEIMSISSAV